MSVGAFYNQQTAYDYWLNFSPQFLNQFSLNIPQGNLTNDPLVNQLLQQGNALHSYALLPTTLTMAGGDPNSLSSFKDAQFLNNPGDMTSTQLAPISQAVFGATNFPYLVPPRPFEPSGYTTLGDIYSGPFGIRPAANNYVRTGYTSGFFA